MRMTFWGVRGCIPSPGPAFNRYGGNTACIEIQSPAGQRIILDAGTGIIPLGSEWMKGDWRRGKGEATLLITHTHWDHIQGFSFFAPLYVSGNRLSVHGASGSETHFMRALEGQMNPHFSPIQSMQNFAAEMHFNALREGSSLTLQDVTVDVSENPHGRVSALAFRLTCGDTTIAYAPDANYIDGQPSRAIRNLYENATYLIHDCTYAPEDGIRYATRGYSSIDIAAQIAAKARVKNLVMFHYDQDYTDDQVDQLKDRCRALLDQQPNGRQVNLIPAYEGLTL